MDENDIEVLPDGRIALILHDGKVSRGMSTHEVKAAFVAAFWTSSSVDDYRSLTDAVRVSGFTKQLELK